jgi:putative nucleotidyltransferase with HDIG domain
MRAAVAQLNEVARDGEAQRLTDLVAALELKDGCTGEHTSAVSRLAGSLATRLGLTSGERRTVELGALLHDVGKLAIPDRILIKPGPLTEIEWASMRRHAVVGESLLARVLDLPEVLVVVRSHHERWDGQGYPDGLVGEAIPLSARIVSVADAFHAMTEPRPYREPRTKTAALAEIVSQSGCQFDPTCVHALKAIV